MSTLTLNLDDRHDEALTRLAAETDMSKTAVLRQALRLYQLVHNRAKDGQKLAFTKDGRTVVVELIGPTLMPLEGSAGNAGVQPSVKRLSLDELWKLRDRSMNMTGQYELGIQLLFARKNGLRMTAEENADLDAFLARPAGMQEVD